MNQLQRDLADDENDLRITAMLLNDSVNQLRKLRDRDYGFHPFLKPRSKLHDELVELQIKIIAQANHEQAHREGVNEHQAGHTTTP